MVDVRAALVLVGYTLPIISIRYAPTGKYRVGSEQIEIHRSEREKALNQVLAKVCLPGLTPTKQESDITCSMILVSKEEGPQITLDQDFPDFTKHVASWKQGNAACSDREHRTRHISSRCTTLKGAGGQWWRAWMRGDTGGRLESAPLFEI